MSERVWEERQTFDEGLFLVVDVGADAGVVSGNLRAFVTGQCGGHEEWEDDADKAAEALPPEVYAWCCEHVSIEYGDTGAHRPDVFPHVVETEGYTGGGVAIEIDSMPPEAVLRALRERATLYGKSRRGAKVIGARLVKMHALVTTIAEVG